jgi:diphthamide synthase (EF-2-diphthine--ammonia ligase)
MVIEERLNRNKETQEFFTPEKIVIEMLSEVPENFFKDLKPFKETSVGTGNIAVQVIERYKKYHSLENILKNIQLGDIMLDNCIECIKRICNNVSIVPINPPKEKESNGLIKMFKIDGFLVDWIVQADATKFFWWQKTQQEKLFDELFHIKK